MLAVFLGLFGHKLAQIERYGSDLPFWDAWDAEGDYLFRPYLKGELTAAVWTKPHNEHRILFTRVMALALFDANDHQWDARVELVANAALHSLAGALLAGFALLLLPFWGAVAFAALTVFFLGSPVANENTLSGFQSQFYFLLLIPGLHLWASLMARERSLAWWLAPLAGLAALFTMASGFFSALAVLAVAGALFLRSRRVTPALLWLALPNLAIAAFGWSLKVDVAQHAVLKAADSGAWLDAWLHQLSWPVEDLWFAPIGAIAFLVYLIAFLKGKLAGRRYQVLLAAGVWSWLQYAAIAYARGGGRDHGYASRYTDILAIAVLINLLMLASVALRACRARTCWGIAAATIFYLGAVIWGYLGAIAHARQDPLAAMSAVNAARIDSVRTFVATKDFAFYGKEPWSELPYPSATRLASLLQDSTVRAILPSSVRPGLPLQLDPAASAGFGDYAAPGLAGPAPLGLDAVATGPASTRTSEAHFVSIPFTTDHAIVSVYVAGTGDESSVQLALYDHANHPIAPQDNVVPPGNRWRRVNFHTAPGTYQLSVRYQGDGWFAVSQPTTDTTLSRLAERISHQAPAFLIAAALTLLAALATSALGRFMPLEAA